MRIQIVDQEKLSMFPLGSAEMYDHTRKLLGLVVEAIRQLPNKIAITGHTDSRPYAPGQHFSNWELSTERANASRRALIAAGLPESRIASVIGKADQEPLVTEDPTSPRNRRISIILLHETPDSGH
jgi:chemotaxis protein MotB